MPIRFAFISAVKAKRGKHAQSVSLQCLPHCRGEALVLTRKVRDARVDSTQRGAFACFAILLRHLRIERLSARVAVHSYLTPTRYRCACCGVLRLRAYKASGANYEASQGRCPDRQSSHLDFL